MKDIFFNSSNFFAAELLFATLLLLGFIGQVFVYGLNRSPILTEYRKNLFSDSRINLRVSVFPAKVLLTLVILFQFILYQNYFAKILDLYFPGIIFESEWVTYLVGYSYSEELRLCFVILILVFAILLLDTFVTALRRENCYRTEAIYLYLTIVLACCLMLKVSNYLYLFLALELQALCFYTISCLKPNQQLSTEGSITYTVTGAFFSCIFLLGIGILYTETSNFDYKNIEALLSDSFSYTRNLDFDSVPYYFRAKITFAFILILSSFLFKLGAGPFHYWITITYSTAPLASLSVFSTFPKIPLFLILGHIIMTSGEIASDLVIFIVFSAITSIYYGGTLAYYQKVYKKVIIYGGIAQVGYLLLGIVSLKDENFAASILYLISYLTSLSLIWALMINSKGQKHKVQHVLNRNLDQVGTFTLTHIRKEGLSNYIIGIGHLLALFSFTGLPPLSTFLSKFYIFFSLIRINELVKGIIIVESSINSSTGFFIITFLLFVGLIAGYAYFRFMKGTLFESSIFMESQPHASNYTPLDRTYLYKDDSPFIVPILLFFSIVHIISLLFFFILQIYIIGIHIY